MLINKVCKVKKVTILTCSKIKKYHLNNKIYIWYNKSKTPHKTINNKIKSILPLKLNKIFSKLLALLLSALSKNNNNRKKIFSLLNNSQTKTKLSKYKTLTAM